MISIKIDQNLFLFLFNEYCIKKIIKNLKNKNKIYQKKKKIKNDRIIIFSINIYLDENI
jgi:hypothetical protein